MTPILKKTAIGKKHVGFLPNNPGHIRIQRVFLYQQSCLGFGVCAHCQSGAMKMAEREKNTIPPKNYKDLMIYLMKEKGHL
jgi:hypothetical protein